MIFIYSPILIGIPHQEQQKAISDMQTEASQNLYELWGNMFDPKNNPFFKSFNKVE